jgi:quercetin dioxygenase-like cupin family protein
MSIAEEYAQRMKTAFARTTYGQWVANEGVKIYEGFAVGEDIRTLDLGPWPRLEGKGLFLNLYPLMEGVRGTYLCEIPPGGALAPEHHLYEKIVFILSGHGTTEVWQDGDAQKHVFEWGAGSIFAPPLNVWHRMYNLSNEPARFLAVNDAPLVMNGFRSAEFIFNCPYAFRDRYDGRENYFAQSDKRWVTSQSRTASNIWETNFIHNAFEAELEANEVKAHGNRSFMFEMSGNSLIGHIAQWPVGCYHKAHFHGAGALLMGLRSEGYVLLWPRQLGIRPYEDGHGDQVIQVPWGPGTLYAPPSDWFHQHFNTGNEPARHLATRHGSRLAGPGFDPLTRRDAEPDWNPQHESVRSGGALIEYEDEDPEIRRQYRDALDRNAVECEMPEEMYATGASTSWHDPRLESLLASGRD